MTIATVPHHREYQVERAGTSNLEQDYLEKLRTSFDRARKYRQRISYQHAIMIDHDEMESFDDPFSPTGRQSPKNNPSSATTAPKDTRSKGFGGFFDFGKRRLKMFFFTD